ncbi:MAG TPA: type II toxin-antitoxin system HicB family antitoxin [Spirochaetia bacterium]|nr:type II toxin-antitoxin system HicB family antitoxin [Synergistaceae bacterium]HRW25647.1 type II toxin-antitoxin system HicB family antitoxin [Spirochaetia bacterium]
MEYKLNLHIEMVENGQYVATSPDVPGLVAQGRTVRETVEIAEDVAKKIMESCLENDDAVPGHLEALSDNAVLDLTVAI